MRDMLDGVHLTSCTRYGLSQTRTGAAAIPVKLGAMSWVGDMGEHSRVSAWMPTNFKVTSNSSHVVALGYINNVNPESQGSLHNGLCAILAGFLPLFSKTLGDLHSHVHRSSLLGSQRSSIDTTDLPIDAETGEPVKEFSKSPYEEAIAEALNEAAAYQRLADGRTDKFFWKYDRWCPKAYTQWMNDNVATLYTDPSPEDYVKTDRELGSGYNMEGKVIQVITKITEV